MTRKRFIKKLMSIGYSRNDANLEARAAVGRGFSYDSEYFYILCKKNGLVPPKWSEAIGEAAIRMRQKIADMTRTIFEVIPTIVEAICEVIPQVIANIERLKQEEESDT